jgi:MerR family copper efflux transcriptional regulator
MTTDAAPATGPGAVPSMHIGEVAARTDLSLRSLRHLDDVGLLNPSGRTDGGFRLYTEADVEKILLIRRMKPLGFTLGEMSAAMRDIETLQASPSDERDASSAKERLNEILRGAVERREKLVRQLVMADEFIDLLSHEVA